MDKRLLSRMLTLSLTAAVLAVPGHLQAATPSEIGSDFGYILTFPTIKAEAVKEDSQPAEEAGEELEAESAEGQEVAGEVPPDTTPLEAPPDSLAEAAAVVEVVEESPLAPYLGKVITKQSVAGNDVIPVEAILGAVGSKPGMEFTETGIAEDMSSIYALGWFYEVHPEFEVVPEGVHIIYHVSENPVYQDVNIEGMTVIAKGRARSFFSGLEAGRIANLSDINKCVQNLEEEYRSTGYILARVTDVHMAQDGTLNVAVSEGIVEDFKVKGNTKCKDYVITREMRLKKGEPFNARLARRSMQRIYNLGYFEDVDVKLKPGHNPDAIEVEINVVEMNTGTFGIGAGYSNADGFIGMISLGDKNFRGIGDRINIRWEFGGEDYKNYDFTYTRPWIDSKETAVTVNLYDITNEYADYNIDGDRIARYDKQRIGQEVTFSRKTHNEFISNYVTLKHRKDSYDGEADGYEGETDQYYEEQFNNSNKYESWMPATAKERRKENFGQVNSITFGRVFDSRDNVYDPHEGKRLAYSVEWASFGGDFDFLKFSADWRWYYHGGGESVWAVNLVAGYADGDMPLSQRFSMGGSDTLRGYEDDQFRGNSMLKATLEYRFPLVKKVQGVLFSDNGYAWDKRHEDDFDLGLVKDSVGVGLRINSPLGPVKLDYGYGDDGGRFHFSFGGQF